MYMVDGFEFVYIDKDIRKARSEFLFCVQTLFGIFGETNRILYGRLIPTQRMARQKSPIWVSNVNMCNTGKGRVGKRERGWRKTDDLLCDGCLLPALALPTARTGLLAIVGCLVRLQLSRMMETMRLKGGWAVEESCWPIGFFLGFRLIAVDLPVDEHLTCFAGQLFISPRLQLVLQLVANVGQCNVTDKALCKE